MLTGKNVVIVKIDKNTPAVIQDYDRVYLEFASTDPTETYSKTSEGKDLMVTGSDGSQIKWEGLRPKDSVTKADPKDLVPEALAYFQKEYPGTAEKPTDPWFTLLQAASYGADLWKRNEIQANIRPGKPVDKSTAVAKMVKLIMALNPKISMDAAKIAAEAACSAE